MKPEVISISLLMPLMPLPLAPLELRKKYMDATMSGVLNMTRRSKMLTIIVFVSISYAIAIG